MSFGASKISSANTPTPPSNIDPIHRALLENEDWCRDLVEHSHDLLCVHDLKGRLLAINSTPARILGYTVEELLQIPMQDVVCPEYRSDFDEYLKRIAHDGEASGLLALQTRSGEKRLWEYHNTLRREGTPSPIVRGTAHDVTERLRAERALQLKVADLNRAQEVAHVGSWSYNMQTRSLTFTDEAYRILGLASGTRVEPEEGLKIIHPDDQERVREAWRAALRSGEYVLEHRILVRGRERWVHSRAEFLLDAEKRPTACIGMIQDITERRLAEKQLQEYERVFEGLEEMIAVVDRNYRYVIANRAFLNRKRAKSGDIVGTTVGELVGQQVFEGAIREKLEQCFQGKVIEYELRHPYPEIGERDLWISYLPIEGANGIDRVACVIRDITERKQAASALRESERRFRVVFEKSPVGVCIADVSTGRFVKVNPKFCEITGRKEEELIGQPVKSISTGDEEESAKRMRRLTSGETDRFETERKYLRPDGTSRWAHVSVVRMSEPGETPPLNIAIVQDITGRVEAEDALRESEARERAKAKELETILDAVPVPVLTAHDVACTHITGNVAGNALLRLPAGGNASKSVPPEEQPPYSFLKEGVEPPPEELPMQVAARTATPVKGSPWTLVFDDGDRREIVINAAPLIGPDSKVFGAVGAFLDLTERKRAEEALGRSEQRFRVALDGSHIKVFNQDRDLRYTWAYNLPDGWTNETFLGKTDEEVFGPEEGARLRELKTRVLETGQGLRDEIILNNKGESNFCDITIEPLRDASGSVVGVNSSCVDVTHLRRITEELRQAKEKLAEEKLYLEEAIHAELGFGEIVGESRALQSVLEQVQKVAGTDATVLLLGETGTGKELIARAIHKQSLRADKSFIKMNCASIPSGLLESELFGHEKGAFTGAVTQKVGRVELADRGTLFLDEIGELPLSLQPKLLRILQDQEFERLGSNRTLKVNFRLVAATNRNLQQTVNAKQFRSDLYYRLNVFPVRIPPLRERRKDIPLLVEHFVSVLSVRMNRRITSIPTKTMEALVEWDWPGNVRELENFIERSVILSRGSVLQAPIGELSTGPHLENLLSIKSPAPPKRGRTQTGKNADEGKR